VMMVIGLQLFMGNSGVLAWTHIGFVGVGAYAASILSTSPAIKHIGVPNMYPFLADLQIPVIPALILGALVAALLAALIAWPLMRLSDAVGVITIFSALIIMHVVMTQWDNVTNGPRTFFGVEAFTTLWVALFGAMISIVIASIFRESPLGLQLRASRDDRHAAVSVGINIVKVRYFSFILSAFMAGLAGGVWAHFITAFSPKAFYLTEIFVLLSMLVIGGSGSVSGALVGTVIVTLVRELLRQFENILNNSNLGLQFFGITEIILAIFMVVVLIWKPGGIVGGRELTWENFRKKPKEETK
jgi:branched-chain amino acid transport system permease protein